MVILSRSCLNVPYNWFLGLLEGWSGTYWATSQGHCDPLLFCPLDNIQLTVAVLLYSNECFPSLYHYNLQCPGEFPPSLMLTSLTKKVTIITFSSHLACNRVCVVTAEIWLLLDVTRKRNHFLNQQVIRCATIAASVWLGIENSGCVWKIKCDARPVPPEPFNAYFADWE